MHLSLCVAKVLCPKYQKFCGHYSWMVPFHESLLCSDESRVTFVPQHLRNFFCFHLGALWRYRVTHQDGKNLLLT